MGTIVKLEKVTGGYTSNRPVIHNVSFHVNAGEIVGLIGLNGAGKSTTIKHILGLMHPFSGSIYILGKQLSESREQYRKQFTYIPETPVLYEELTLWEHLKLTAMAYDIPETTFELRADQLLREFHMFKMKHWFPSQFSKGMRQKVMIMCAFLVEPPFYIIDEPFIGLDPIGIQSLLNWMVKCKENGASVLMSTHILATAEKYCDRIIILHEGKVTLQGTLASLRAQAQMPHATLDDIYLKVAQGDYND